MDSFFVPSVGNGEKEQGSFFQIQTLYSPHWVFINLFKADRILFSSSDVAAFFV